MNAPSIPTPTGPVVVIAPARDTSASQAVFIDGFIVGHLARQHGGETLRFTPEFGQAERAELAGAEADAHEIARRLGGQHFTGALTLHAAIHAQERFFCDGHGESDRYGFCDECAALA